MSSMRGCQRGSQRDGVSPDVVIAIEEPAGGHDINRSLEQHGESVLEMDEVEQRAVRLELDEEIDVARGVLVAASHRSEHGDRSSVMQLGERDDLATVPF